MATVVIKDLTLLIVPHPMMRQWLTLLGFLVTAVIILLVVGWDPPVVHTSLVPLMLLYGCLYHYYNSLYKDCVSTIASIVCKISTTDGRCDMAYMYMVSFIVLLVLGKSALSLA